jgi:hypothetical protein
MFHVSSFLVQKVNPLESLIRRGVIKLFRNLDLFIFILNTKLLKIPQALKFHCSLGLVGNCTLFMLN